MDATTDPERGVRTPPPRPKRLAHLVLRVRGIQRSEKFYTTILGLEVRDRSFDMVFLSLDETSSHDLALMPLPSDAPGPEETRAGLYHFAWQLESFDELKRMHEHLKENKVEIVGYGEHGISSGIHFLDPDGNEIEVFYELPRDQWPKGELFIGKFPWSLEDA